MDGPIYGTQTSHEIHTHASYSTFGFRVVYKILEIDQLYILVKKLKLKKLKNQKCFRRTLAWKEIQYAVLSNEIINVPFLLSPIYLYANFEK